MSEYTPTTMEIEACFLAGAGHSTHAGSRKEAFARWLAAHDAEVRAGVVTEEPEWEYGIRAEGDEEPYTDYSDDADWIGDQVTPEPGDAIVRRRKAGLWVPVRQEGADDA